MHPTSDDWYPSYNRGYQEEPEEYPECECWECLAIPSDKKKEHFRWLWKEGGEIACYLWIYDQLKKTYEGDDYIARVSFWGLDDTGMEKHFRYEEDARYFVCHLPPFISKEFLLDHGFVAA